MLKKKQIREIREHLEKSQNPLFFFDNDQDGLCSYLLLRRFLGRGKGVPVKTNPLSEDYFRRVREFNPDYIFILDVPEVSKDFFNEVQKLNLPVVWIDHHGLRGKSPNFVSYYDPLLNKKKSNEPVTALCHQIANKKEDSWLGVVGCISDKFIPKFYKDFLKKYPELGKKSKNAFDIFYNTDLGKICMIFGASLKDKTTNVMNMLRFLIDAKGPYDVLEESKGNLTMHKRFREINSKEEILFEKAKANYDGGETFIFKYESETSMSASLANRASYFFPNKIIVIGHVKGNKINFSIRGKNVKNKFLKIISNMENARGGGHEEAIGIQIEAKDWDFFKKEASKPFSEDKKA